MYFHSTWPLEKKKKKNLFAGSQPKKWQHIATWKKNWLFWVCLEYVISNLDPAQGTSQRPKNKYKQFTELGTLKSVKEFNGLVVFPLVS